MSNFIPKEGEDSPHTIVLRINWEILPMSPNGSYGHIPPVDLGLMIMRSDKKTFKECEISLDILLKKLSEEKEFAHLFRKGRIL